ncbi:MAG: cysteine desulfurase NifS [Methanoculleus sp.]|jgi:cysteine desulfurase|uniref:cysteine desulfurase NifS n=1 Tax=Methanoculleus sp. TaxID=90427 RepID=UPI0025FDCC0B|nr:cysteine desulfurase NifS [Methanoculleus sp.]MCK9317889.1 cysteine desulfurase NifS [Methanoculleus sp.]MDD2253679.1 cysteine desulfurase NifS [Methanoculleus sp.]MDD3217038.1 cysteine desulfurase NifS [Methanoculleus sp.]MDD4314520.1 cysteine desulfurase NifS [Methanoculleus sp.]MDD4470757.1 cysteine desulfurase NifS [Methanoculleus sp.]
MNDQAERPVYMDHAATTFIKPEVIAAMAPYFSQYFGNPSSLYRFAGEPRKGVDAAREQVAAALGATPAEVFFCAGGSEADNWAIKGVALANHKRGDHIVTTAIEHHAVLHTCEWLEKHGFSVTYLPVDKFGRVDPGDVEEAITGRTVLVSVMTANNEIGTIQPVARIGRIAHDHDVLFHTDAVQAIGAVPIDVESMNIDLLSLSGHKFYGPKGTGALYVRRGTRLENLVHGGGQERGRRAGTENVPGIVGLGKAIEVATADIEGHNRRLVAMRDRLIREVLSTIPDSRLNGHPTERLANNANFSFRYVEGESILLMLDARGICASTGSACSSASLEPSHVLLATGLAHEEAHGSLRLTLGDANTPDDVEYVLSVLPEVIGRLRQISPLTPPAGKRVPEAE